MLKHAFTDFIFSTTMAVVAAVVAIRRFTFATSHAVLAVIAVMGTFACAWAAEIQTEEVGGRTWQFTIENGKARIYGGLLKSAIGATRGHVDVPDRLGGSPVKVIGSYAFNAQTNITSITIPEGIEEMEFYACRGCTSLRSIDLPSTLRAMGNAVFIGCTNLLVGVVPDGVTTMGRDMFYNCKSMTSVTFSRNVKSLDACRDSIRRHQHRSLGIFILREPCHGVNSRYGRVDRKLRIQ